MANGERQLRRRSQAIEKKDFYSICCKNICCCLCEEPTIISAIMRNSYFHLLIGKTLLQVICISLCGRAYGILVHPIGAHTHYSAKPARTKLQVLIKCIRQLVGVFFLQTQYFIPGLLIKISIKPG